MENEKLELKFWVRPHSSLEAAEEWKQLLWESDSWSSSQMCFHSALRPWESHFFPGDSGLSATEKESPPTILHFSSKDSQPLPPRL